MSGREVRVRVKEVYGDLLYGHRVRVRGVRVRGVRVRRVRVRGVRIRVRIRVRTGLRGVSGDL